MSINLERENQHFEGLVDVGPEAPVETNVRETRQPLRVFIREENKRLADTVRKLEERIINLEKMIG
jgi:hypothetical protein